MPATITAEERSAIDAAIAAGRVTKIARGRSANDMPHLGTDARFVVAKVERARLRRAAAFEMRDAGASVPEIAAKLGAAEETVKTWLRRGLL